MHRAARAPAQRLIGPYLGILEECASLVMIESASTTALDVQWFFKKGAYDHAIS